MINIKPRRVSSFDKHVSNRSERQTVFKNVTSQHIKNWRVSNSIFRKSTPCGRPCRGLIHQTDRQTNSPSVGDHRDLPWVIPPDRQTDEQYVRRRPPGPALGYFTRQTDRRTVRPSETTGTCRGLIHQTDRRTVRPSETIGTWGIRGEVALLPRYM